MKIYTKKGDKGKTSLLGGARVSKHHIRIEAYGTVDELNSYLGLLRDTVNDRDLNEKFLKIQDRLFTLGSELAMEPGKTKIKIPHLEDSDIEFLEHEIDEMDKKLEPLRAFVLPGGHVAVSHCHVARCICRRAERRCTELAERDNVSPLIIQYLNRLSDYLFTLSRFLSSQLGAIESPWVPKM